MTAPPNADAVWARVRADIEAAHAALGTPDVFDRIDKPTQALMRIAACFGWSRGTDEAPEKIGAHLAGGSGG